MKRIPTTVYFQTPDEFQFFPSILLKTQIEAEEISLLLNFPGTDWSYFLHNIPLYVRAAFDVKNILDIKTFLVLVYPFIVHRTD